MNIFVIDFLGPEDGVPLGARARRVKVERRGVYL
jgi:hypothetical protein